VLTFCLHRFDLDYNTMERFKINSRFEYPLELDMHKYTQQFKDNNQADAESVYELKSIIVHRGGAFGGHYHAYIRDDFNIGKWNLQVPEEFEAEPSEDIKKDANKAAEEKKPATES